MFKTILCKEVGQKINKKLPEIVKKLETLVFPKYSVFQGSPKQQVCSRLKRLNTVVHEVYRYFDRKWKKRNLIIFRNFVFFDLDSGQFPIEKLYLSLF